jgi:hypothetical protein
MRPAGPGSPLAPREPARAALRNRLISGAIVGAYTILAALLVPDAERRASVHYAVVITLGYGHLVGALAGARGRLMAAARPRTSAARGRRLVARVLAWTIVLAAFAAFTTLAASSRALVLALLALSTWHVAENDLALEETYARGGRVAPLRWRPDEQIAALGLTALVLAAAAAPLSALPPSAAIPSPDTLPPRSTGILRGLAVLAGVALLLRETSGRSESIGLALVGAGVLLPGAFADGHGPAFADVFALATGYHLASFIVLTWDRGRSAGPGAGRLLLATHALPVALALFCLGWPASGSAWLRDALFAPAPYLFWSVAHVLHTGALRTRASRAHPHPAQSGSGGGSRDASRSSTSGQ